MRSRHPFSRWISQQCAERYVARFGGKVFEDRLNGYTTLFGAYRQLVAFVQKEATDG